MTKPVFKLISYLFVAPNDVFAPQIELQNTEMLFRIFQKIYVHSYPLLSVSTEAR